MYDLNQILYVYTVEVASRFKRLNLLGRVHEELWQEISIIQKAVIMITSKKKKCKKEKWLSDYALQVAMKRREAKGKGEKENIYSFECRFPKKNKER